MSLPRTARRSGTRRALAQPHADVPAHRIDDVVEQALELLRGPCVWRDRRRRREHRVTKTGDLQQRSLPRLLFEPREGRVIIAGCPLCHVTAEAAVRWALKSRAARYRARPVTRGTAKEPPARRAPPVTVPCCVRRARARRCISTSTRQIDFDRRPRGTVPKSSASAQACAPLCSAQRNVDQHVADPAHFLRVAEYVQTIV